MSKRRPVNAPKKVLLVDDHPILRRGVQQTIALEPDLVVCGEAGDIQTALALAERERPDAAIIDISLRDGSGVELIRQMRARWPQLAMLVLSMHDEVFYAERVFRAGARGYICKGEPCQQVVDGVRQVLRGEVFVSEWMAAKMVSKMVGGPGDGGRLSIERLSARELEVFELIGRGIQTRDVARKLNLSVKTVDSHRENIKDKLNLKNASELLRAAIQWVEFEGRA